MGWLGVRDKGIGERGLLTRVAVKATRARMKGRRGKMSPRGQISKRPPA
jgi:hypothetical protein